MADAPEADPRTGDVAPGHGAAPRTPRWVKVFAVVAVVVVLVFVVMLVSGGRHGPGRHTGGGGGHGPPAGGHTR